MGKKVAAGEISERYIAEFQKDYSLLGLREPSHTPRVTEHIDNIINTIEKIIKNHKAYVVEGEVFYSIDNFPDYGKLSPGKKLEDLEVGQRVAVDARKKNPLDFVLWKPAKAGEPCLGFPLGKGAAGLAYRVFGYDPCPSWRIH